MVVIGFVIYYEHDFPLNNLNEILLTISNSQVVLMLGIVSYFLMTALNIKVWISLYST